MKNSPRVPSAGEQHGESELLSPELSARLQHLNRLAPDWDGYGAVPPTQWALATARSTLLALADRSGWALDEVFVVPSVDGGVRLEWVAESGRELTLILPPADQSMVRYYRFSVEPAFEDEVEAEDVKHLPAMLEWVRAT